MLSFIAKEAVRYLLGLALQGGTWPGAGSNRAEDKTGNKLEPRVHFLNNPRDVRSQQPGRV